MNNYKKMPKIELHLHLDGSLDIKNIRKKYKISKKELQSKMIADEKCQNLNDYLTKFDFPITIMQTKEELEDAVINLLRKLKKQNVIYVEIRFAPQFHIKKGLTQDQVVETVINASKNVDIKSNFILCIMRGKDNMDLNYETLEVAKKYFGKGVCAVDLAGAEALYKTANYEEIFKKVVEYNIPFTIHAGEADGPESIESAIKFGASRIGHGVRCIENEELMNIIKSKNITLEICPTSNIQTCVYNNYKEHSIKQIYEKGIKVTVNTDNMTVSNTDLANEYKKLEKYIGLTKKDFIEMNKNAINSAFISDKEKEELLKYYKN